MVVVCVVLGWLVLLVVGVVCVELLVLVFVVCLLVLDMV